MSAEIWNTTSIRIIGVARNINRSKEGSKGGTWM